MRVATINLDADRDGDRRLIRRARDHHGAEVLFLQERGGKGRMSTRILVPELPVEGRRRIPLGDIGAHNHLASARVGPTRLLNYHGLHVGTVGEAAATACRFHFAAHVWGLTAQGVPWVAGMDANHGWRKMGRLLGGNAVGSGVDAIITSPGLRPRLVAVDRWGQRHGLTGHPMIVADV